MSVLPESDRADDFRSGFVAVVGRPNVGKSTLVNRILGTKVTIVSSRPNTTRRSVRGVLHRDGYQAVLVDTPGLHRPRTALGERLNDHVAEALADLDVVVAVVDASGEIGAGDRIVLDRAMQAVRGSLEAGGTRLFVAINKIDKVTDNQLLGHLDAVNRAVEGLGELFPVSAVTGQGVEALSAAILERLPAGPPYFPGDMVTDVPEAFWVAELVREELLRRVREELPHAIACRVTEWEWPRVRVEILVERESQKGIVIGKGGAILKEVGTAVRHQLPEGAFIELHVRVEKDWQSRPDAIERLGY
jgi:GTP-binding protein Era